MTPIHQSTPHYPISQSKARTLSSQAEAQAKAPKSHVPSQNPVHKAYPSSDKLLTPSSQTKSTLETAYPATKIYTYVADITDRGTLGTTFQAIKSVVRSVDILIANAGYMPDLYSIAASDPEDWWAGFEINVRGAFNLISSFVPVASKNASIINISTAVSHMPYAPSGSGYAISKLAGTRIFDYVAHEYPEFFVLSLHPGVIETAMDAKTVAAGINFPHDTINLPADFVAWAVSSDAKFLRGKMVWSNWDVGELKAMDKEIEGTVKFTIGLLGWP